MKCLQPLLTFCLLSCLCLLASGPARSTSVVAPEYVLWVGGNAPGRAEHEALVIREALERTREEFGPYRLTVSNDTSKAANWRQILAVGEDFHVVASSYMDFPPEELTLIPVPIAGGRLGYRNLVVKKGRLSEFAHIKNADQLSGFTAGQGSTWPDMWVYEANGLPIEGGNGMPDLIAMLEREEVDYLPLGVEETQAILDAFAPHTHGFAIVPDLLIYYPLSSFPVVSNNQPNLLRRLQVGLESMHADGSLNNGLAQSKSSHPPRDCRVIQLENPSRLFPLF